MKENSNNAPKDFGTSEETQQMKNTDDLYQFNLQNSQYERTQLIIARLLIVFIIFLIIGMIIFIFYDALKDRFSTQNINTQLNQAILKTDKLEYTPYAMNHNKPDIVDLKNYEDYLPKNKKGKAIQDLKDIFDSKYLYIKNDKINFDYIYILRQKDFEDTEQERNLTYQNSTLNFYIYDPIQKPIPPIEFYELCENENIKKQKNIELNSNPLITIIIVAYNKAQNLLRTIKSIQNQSLKNIEIIIVDDEEINLVQDYKTIISGDPRIRVLIQKESYGLWRKRMDGLLYSKGEYILHMDAGHILADNLVLEDIYNLSKKYDLDTVRFSFSKTYDNKEFKKNKIFEGMHKYPINITKIVYGRPKYNITQEGFGTIWNRLVKADMFFRGLDLVDSEILNIKKNLWDGLWWNDLIDRVSFSNLVVNRFGYVYFYDKKIAIKPNIRDNIEKDETINEFIDFWYFNLILLPEKDDKKTIVDTIKKFNGINNTYGSIQIRLDYLQKKSPILLILIKKLLADPNVLFPDKIYLTDLSKQIRNMIKSKKEQAKERKKEKAIYLKQINKNINRYLNEKNENKAIKFHQINQKNRNDFQHPSQVEPNTKMKLDN